MNICYRYSRGGFSRSDKRCIVYSRRLHSIYCIIVGPFTTSLAPTTQKIEVANNGGYKQVFDLFEIARGRLTGTFRGRSLLGALLFLSGFGHVVYADVDGGEICSEFAPNVGDPFDAVYVEGTQSQCAGSTALQQAGGGGDCDFVAATGCNPSCSVGEHCAKNRWNTDHKYTWSVSATASISHKAGSLDEKCYVRASHNDFSSYVVEGSRTEVSTNEGTTHSDQMTVDITEPSYALLTISKHSAASAVDVDEKMLTGTTEVLLDGEFNANDVHCCKGIKRTGAVETFSDSDVHATITGFANINTQAKWDAITGAWAVPAKKKIVVVVESITWDPLQSLTGPDRPWTVGGKGGKIYIGTAQGSGKWIHEWGHAGGGLIDQYNTTTMQPNAGYEDNVMFAGEQEVRSDQCAALP